MKIFFKNSRGLRLAAFLNRVNDSDSIIIVVHGSASSKDGTSARLQTEEFNKQLINTLTIDLTGCGESEGDYAEQTITTSVDDVLSAVDYIKSQGFSNISFFGSSAGGLAVMAASLNFPELKLLGLKAPVSDWADQYLWRYGQGFIDEWKQKGFYEFTSHDVKYRVNYSLYEDVKNYVMYDKVKSIKCPTLIVHALDDLEVSVEQSKRLAKGFINAHLIILDSGGHKLRNAVSTIGEWFAQNI